MFNMLNDSKSNDVIETATDNIAEKPEEGEKVSFTKEALNTLISERINKAKQSEREKVLAELKANNEAGVPPMNDQQQNPQLGGMSVQDVAIAAATQEARRVALEEVQRAQNNNYGQMQINTFEEKASPGFGRFENYEKNVRGLNIANVPALIPILNEIPDLPALLHELGKDGNEHLFSNIIQLVSHGSLEKAKNALHRMSKSIVANEEAKNVEAPKEPSSPIKHSNAGLGNGKMSVDDLRFLDWMSA